MKKELARLDKLILEFKRVANDYPSGSYNDTVAKLEKERAELVSKIGRKSNLAE